MNSGRTELRLAMEATLAALADAGIDPSEVDGFSSYTMDKVPEYEIARLLGCQERQVLLANPARRRRGLRADAARRHGGGHRHRQDGGGVPRHERAQPGTASAPADYGFGSSPIFENVNYGWYMPYGFHTPAAWVGHVRPALHARLRRHQRGLWPRGRGGARLCRHQPGRFLPRQADHAGRAPGLALDLPSRCTCWTAARSPTAPWPW